MSENEASPPSESMSKQDGGKSSKLVVAVLFFNLLVSLGLIVTLFLWHQKEKSKATVDDIVSGRLIEGSDSKATAQEDDSEPDAANEEQGKVIPLDVFTVNLTSASGSGPRYVKIAMSIELEPEQEDEEVKAKLARVRDTIINILNSKKPQELASVEGRDSLKDEVKKALNSFLEKCKVKSIYFTNFQITS